jgi:hypothetical protein
MRTLHMLHTLDTPTGHQGSTVRNGMKWADALGQNIELCVCLPTPADHKIEGHAVVTGVWDGKFADIPARLIEREHEERSRTYSGLLASMRHAYGPEFGENNQVVVLTYSRVD